MDRREALIRPVSPGYDVVAMKVELELPAGLSREAVDAAQRAALEAATLQLYRTHAISSGRAAEMLGVPLESFLLWASARGVAVFDLDETSLDDEVTASLDAARPSR